MKKKRFSDFGSRLSLVVYVFMWIVSGFLAWAWIEPTTFWAALLFIAAWALLGFVLQFVGIVIVAGILSLRN